MSWPPGLHVDSVHGVWGRQCSTLPCPPNPEDPQEKGTFLPLICSICSTYIQLFLWLGRCPAWPRGHLSCAMLLLLPSALCVLKGHRRAHLKLSCPARHHSKVSTCRSCSSVPVHQGEDPGPPRDAPTL